MKITHLYIEGLFGKNFDIGFRDDVTFLFGINGCGKTTVLNLTSALISGNLVGLHRYSFSKLILKVQDSSGEVRELVVSRVEAQSPSEGKAHPLYGVQFGGKEGLVPGPVRYQDNDREYLVEPDEDFDWSVDADVPLAVQAQFKEVRDAIRSAFSPIYLPLTRKDTSVEILDTRSRMASSRIRRMESTLEASVRRAVRLIATFASRATRLENHILEDLKAEVLRQALMTQDMTPADLTSVNQYLTDKHREELSAAISGLKLPVEKDLGVISERIHSLRESFTVTDSGELAITNPLGFATYVSAASQLRRLHEIASSVTRANERRKLSRRPLTQLLTILNSFLADSGKEVSIEDTNSSLVFRRLGSNDDVAAYRLSSGEKQLLIFFVYVILGLRHSSSGIFIVDEPELSLHLAWQRRFVPSLMEVASDVQLIFATHSPEIVGLMVDRAVEVRGH